MYPCPQAPLWSADGSQIYFNSNRTLEPYYDVPQNAIYSVPENGGEVKKVIGITGDIGAVALSRDGRQFAFRGVINKPVRSYSQDDTQPAVWRGRCRHERQNSAISVDSRSRVVHGMVTNSRTTMTSIFGPAAGRATSELDEPSRRLRGRALFGGAGAGVAA